MASKKEVTREDIVKRLNRIEGQVKGISRMINEDQKCTEILTQVSAVRAAVNSVGGIILEKYANECVMKSFDQGNPNKEEELANMMSTIQKFLKFVD